MVLEILAPALDFVQRCPVDSKVIDDGTPAIACPVCGKVFCLFPCAEMLSSKNKKCPACKKFEMNKLSEIVQNAMHLAKLEELNATGRVGAPIYGKLKSEYESKKQKAMELVYGPSTANEKQGDVS